MKVISRDNLIKIFVSHPQEYFTEDEIGHIINTFGDDWFCVDGSMQMCKESTNMQDYKKLIGRCG